MASSANGTTGNPGTGLASYILICLNILALCLALCAQKGGREEASMIIPLPKPDTTGSISIERAIANRRSVRGFSSEALSTEQLGQLVWAAQGITDTIRGYRAVQSAGATYPLEIYVVTQTEITHYMPPGHALQTIKKGDFRQKLAQAALGQACVREAAAIIVFTAITQRTTSKYAKRGLQYVYMEAGHAAQNVLLQSVALNLGAVPVGAFDTGAVAEMLKCEGREEPLYLVAVGHTQ